MKKSALAFKSSYTGVAQCRIFQLFKINKEIVQKLFGARCTDFRLRLRKP